jgi:transmembrane sensor
MAAADSQRADEALDWVRRIHDPSFTDWEGHAAWLEADSRNLAWFDEAAFTIEAATDALRPPEPFVTSPEPVNDNPAYATAPRRGWRPWGTGLGIAMAAGIVAAVAVPAFMHDQAHPYVVQTSAGEHRVLTLDGTTISLNGESRLRLDRGDTRLATLEQGEALFAVHHDPAHPFTVRAGGATFQDVGTIFDVVKQPRSTKVAVREGAVLYDPEGSAVRLDAGQSIRIAGDAATVRPVDPAAVGGWRTGQLLYRDAPLVDVAGDVARNIGEPVLLDPGLAQRRFSGVVQIDADRSRMFRRMAAVMGVEVQHNPQGWRMRMPAR